MRGLCVIAAWLAAGAAFGQIEVMNLNDSGAGSLREALAGAMAGDTITFASGLTGTINLTSQLEVNQAVTITGPGVTIDGGDSTRLFFVNPGAGQDVALEGLTLANGNAQGGNGGNAFEGGGGGGLGAGGALFAQSGNLTLTDVSLTDNQAVGGNGGNGGPSTNTPGAGGGGGGLGGNGGQGTQADGSNAQLTSGGGGGGGITADGGTGTFGNRFTATAGIGGGEGGDGAIPLGSSPGGNGTFGGGGGGGASDQDASNNAGFFAGGNGGFGGGGGGSSSNVNFDDGNADGGNGGFGGGGGGASANFSGVDAQGGAGGLGGGNGGGNGGGSGAGSGGGGAGLGGAIFAVEGATITINQTAATTNSGNTATAGNGGIQGVGIFGGGPGEAGENGQTAGAFLFAQGASQNVTFDIADGVTQSLNLTGIADETTLTDNTGAAGTGVTNLVKEGLGELALSGAAGFAGSVTVNQGGIAAVSNAVGSTTLNGDLTINSGGELNVEFNGSGVDQFNIAGTANLGGTVNFIELADGVATDTPLAFLTAGSISGQFDNVNTVFLNGSSLTSADVTFSGTQAFVTFGAFMADFAGSSKTRSGASAGLVIDQLAMSDPAAVLDIVNALNNSPDMTAAIESQSNVIGNSSAAAAQAAFTQITSIARSRVNGLGGGLSGGGLSSGSLGFAANQPPGESLVGAESLINQVAYFAPTPRQQFVRQQTSTAWAQAIGGFNRIDGDASSLGVDSQSIGVAVGYERSDYDVNGPAVLGLFFGYTDTDANVGKLLDASEATNLQLGFYGAKYLDNNWSLNGTASFSYLDFDTQRPTVLGTAVGDFSGFAFQGTAELLRHFEPRERLIISPLIGLELSVIHRESYTETGAGALNLSVQNETNEFLNSLVGIQMANNFTTSGRLSDGFHVYTASRFAWGYQYLDDTASTTSSFTAPGSVFTAIGPRRNRGSFRSAFNLEVVPVNRQNLSLFTQYTIDVTSDASDQIVQGGFRLRF